MQTVRELIDAAAADAGDRSFLLASDDAGELTFSAFRERVRHTARRLIALQPHDDKLALAVGRGRPSIELILAALYGGVVPVPLNPTTTAEQLGGVLAESGAGLVISARENQALIESAVAASDWGGRVIAEETLDPAAPGRATADLPPPRAEAEAMVIYTSGTTARPKGVIHHHAGRVSAAHELAARLALGPQDRMLCVLPFYHLNAINSAIVALASRTSLVVCPQFEPGSFWKLAARFGCSWSALVPTMLAQLLALARDSATARDAGLRFVRCSSAPLALDLQQRFEERFGVPVLQGMGMTEAGGTIFQNPAPPGSNKLGSLGMPCGFEVRVLDEQQRPAARGETGEIVLRGSSVMQGYHRDAQATGAVLDGEGWLRSGERGYCDSDGYYYSVGRSREIIIKGGTNIAPREIEAALESHPDVLEAACLGKPDRHLGEEIIAFVVLRAQPGRRPASERELLDACEARVGAFKTPCMLQVVEDLPKNSAGKLQRRRLREAFPQLFAARPDASPSSKPSGDQPFTPARTPLEHWLVRSWAAFLDREQVGIRDDFFELGGYSLLAVRLFARMRQELGIQVPLGLCFDCPTVEGQALAILELVQQRAPHEERMDVAAISLEERRALEQRLLDKLRDAELPDLAVPQSRVAAVLLAPDAEGSSAPGLFCAYGPAQYRELALRLAPAHRVYGLFGQREVDLLATPVAADSDLPGIEEIAALYCEAVQETQPRGPYYLSGFSFGGRIALEMARKLRASGEDVALLVIFDTYMPGSARWNALRFAGDAIRAIPQRLRKLTGRGSGRRHAPTPSLPAETEAARDLEAATAHERQIRIAARARYGPRPYDGPVLLLRAQEPRPLRAGYRTDPTLGWDRIATGTLRLREVPGRHLTILREPHVATLAQLLAEQLEAER